MLCILLTSPCQGNPNFINFIDLHTPAPPPLFPQAIRERNYLHANDIYLKLAIGTAPWPIGVTQVGAGGQA